MRRHFNDTKNTAHSLQFLSLTVVKYWPILTHMLQVYFIDKWGSHKELLYFQWSSPGARPTNDISIEFEIRPKLGPL